MKICLFINTLVKLHILLSTSLSNITYWHKKLGPFWHLSFPLPLSHTKSDVRVLDLTMQEESNKKEGVENGSHTLLYPQHYTQSCGAHTSDLNLISNALKMLCWDLCLVLLLNDFSVWALPSTNIKITQGECHHNQRLRQTHCYFP